VSGTAGVLSGNGVDGSDWSSSRSPFLYQDRNGANAGESPAEPPTAELTASCTELTCDFDASGSRPGSSPITSYSWTFGDATGGAGVSAEHTYGQAGDFEVTLTVTDASGLTATERRVVTVTGPAAAEPPVASFTASCSVLTCSFDGSGSSDPDGDEAGLTYAWEFGDGSAGVGPTAAHTYAAPGTYPVRLTVRDADGLTGTATRSVSPTRTGVVHVGAASTNGNRSVHRVTLPDDVRAGDRLLLLMTVNNTTTKLDGPGGWSLVRGGAVEGNNMRQRVWTRVAAAGDAGSVVRVTSSDFAKSDLTVVAYRSTPGATLSVTGSAGSVGAGGLTSYATPEAELPATGSSWVLSYWAAKAGEGRTWTVPGSEVVRAGSAGSGGGAISALLADSGEGANGARGGGLLGRLDSEVNQAQTFTVVLTSDAAG
jgi:PKD repeat protein